MPDPSAEAPEFVLSLPWGISPGGLLPTDTGALVVSREAFGEDPIADNCEQMKLLGRLTGPPPPPLHTHEEGRVRCS